MWSLLLWQLPSEGCLLGFLRYNFEPAKIYMGDTGSMFIGMMMGALAMIGNYTRQNTVACFAPVLILGSRFLIPFLLCTYGIAGECPVIAGSPDHFALRLRKWRLSTKQTVVISYGISCTAWLCALFIMYLALLRHW